jgi:hypothetical protein
MSPNQGAAIRLIREDYTPLIMDRVLPTVAASRGRPWVEQLSEYFLRKSTRHLEAICTLAESGFGEDGLIVGRALLEHSLYLAWVAAAASAEGQDERAHHFFYDGDRQRLEKRKELERLQAEGKSRDWVDALLNGEMQDPVMAKPAAFAPLPSLKRIADELGGEFETYFYFVYWSVSKLAHPSGMGSHTYYDDDSASECWRALALGFPQHAVMTANTLTMLQLEELRGEIEQLTRRFIALDSGRD